jgi:hypothetical protein
VHYIKLSKNNQVLRTHEFATEAARKTWLLDFGFVDGKEVWYHPFNKEVAGLFEKSLDQAIASTPAYHTCDQRIPLKQRGHLYGK